LTFFATLIVDSASAQTFEKHLLPVIFLRWQFVEPALFLLCHSVLHINMHIGGIHVNVVDGYNSCFQPEDFGYINYKQNVLWRILPF